MNDLDKLQEAKRKYEEHGVDCHQEYIQELEKYTSMWFHLKDYVDHNLIKGGHVDIVIKEIENKHSGE